MTDIYQSYHSGNIRANLPPNNRNGFSHADMFHVQDESQLLRGDYSIPEGCYGASFMIDDDAAKAGNLFLSQVGQAIFVKKQKFHRIDDVVRNFGENSDLCKYMKENQQQFIIETNSEIGKEDYGLPTGYSYFFIVDGEEYNYKIIEFVENTAFGQKSSISIEELHANYVAQYGEKKNRFCYTKSPDSFPTI